LTAGGYRKLYRSRNGRILAGVCAGFSRFTGIDVTLLRLAMVLLSLFAGVGLVFYLAAALIIPNEPRGGETVLNDRVIDTGRNSLVWGIFFIVAGFLVLGWQFNLFKIPMGGIFGIRLGVLWAVFVLGTGLILVLFPLMGGRFVSEKRESTWFRSTEDRKLLGLCGGLAARLGIDSNLVRLLWVVAAFLSGGLAILVYFIVALFLPEKSGA